MSHLPNNQHATLPALVVSRVFLHVRFKFILSLLVSVVTTVPYMVLQKFRVFQPRTFELNWVDRLAGFDLAWMWVYLSYFPLLFVSPWLATKKATLKWFLVGWYVVAVQAWLTFAFFPVDGPVRPDMSIGSGASSSDGLDSLSAHWYRLLVEVDSPGNAFPSLHVGYLVYAMLFSHVVIDRAYGPRRQYVLLAAGWFCTAAVLWSTMATKQHYFVDVLGGLVIAAVGFSVARWGLRRQGQVETA